MATSPPLPLESATPVTAQANSMSRRYLDAYRKAKFLAGLGATVKTLLLIAGGIISFFSLMYMVSNLGGLGGALGFLGLISGSAIGGIGWIMGTMVSAQGELVAATLDRQ